jgi:hypothetical protein
MPLTEPSWNSDAAIDLGEMELPEERDEVLQEVRVHLDLLNKFEGFLPDKVLNKC